MGRELWLGSYFIHGVFYDPLATVLAWKFWGIQSIGAMRLTLQFWNAILPVGVALLFWAIASNGDPAGKPYGKLAMPMFLMAILFAYLITEGRYQTLERRDVPILVGVSLVMLSLHRRQVAVIFLAGLFSAVTYAVTIDRGAYYSLFFILTVAAAALLHRDYRFLGFACSGLISGWIAFYLFFGADETRAFLLSARMIYSTKDLFNSYIYPTPPDILKTLSGSVYAANVIPKIISVCLMAALAYIISDPKRLISRHYQTMLILCLLAVFYYRSALGRSDNGHILYASTFAVLAVTFVAATTVYFSGRWITLVATCTLTAANLLLVFYRGAPLLSANLTNYTERVHDFSQLPDDRFLTEKQRAAIEKLRQVFAGEPCLFNYTSEAAIAYLVRKPTCGSIHIVWFASPRPLREKMLSVLDTDKPNYILFSSPHWANAIDRIPNSVRFPDVDAAIRAQYSPFENANGWIVYKRGLVGADGGNQIPDPVIPSTSQ